MIRVNKAVIERDEELKHERRRVKKLLRLCRYRRNRRRRCCDRRSVVEARQSRHVDKNVDDLSCVVLDGRFELVQGAEAKEGTLRSTFELHQNGHLSLKCKLQIFNWILTLWYAFS